MTAHLRGSGWSDPSVLVDRAEPVEHPFLTDRGEIPLPAWRLDGPQLLDGGCVVLDPEIGTWWALDDHPELMGGRRHPADVTARLRGGPRRCARL